MKRKSLSKEKPTRKNNKKSKTNLENNSAREASAEAMVEYTAEEEEAADHSSVLDLSSAGDVCRGLMERYARSSAPQHRHLCATAAAMQSILSEENIPLTPSAYFCAAIAALRDTDRADKEAVAALSAFLAVVLPLVGAECLPNAKAKDAAFVIVSFVRDGEGGLSTGTLRSLVKSLGLVMLRVDLEDWDSVELPLETLLLFAVDKRPKVRRCAQSSLEVLLKNCHNSAIINMTSKVVHRMHRKYISLAKNPRSIEPTDADLDNILSKSENLEALHMLNVLNTVLPYISEKVRMKILCDVYELLGCHFSWPTRHILRILEALLEHSDVKVLAPKAETIVSALTSYVSIAEKNPADTIVSASSLLKNVLRKFGDAFPSMWIRYLPLLFTSLIGYLGSDSDTSKLVAAILKESINFHINQSLFRLDTDQSDNYKMENSPEAAAVASICCASDIMLKKCSFPTEHMLEIMSVLFLKLGGSSNLFMKEVLITLSQFALNVVDEEKHYTKHLEQCIGAAVIAMGPEKLLSLVPIAFDLEKSSCSNLWIIPILKKYVVGASLQYFMDNIVPLAKYIQEACKKVKKESIRKSLQSCYHSLWDLVPSFCCYPIDISEKIESLLMLFVVVLKEEPSLHAMIASALQVLVHSNRDSNRHCVDVPSNIFSQNFNMEFRNFCYSKKVASENMKAMASKSLELFQILKDIFFESADKRGCIKDALGSLGFVIPSEYIGNFFLSELKSVKQSSDFADFESLDDHVQVENKKVGDAKAALEKNERSCLLMELASSFVEAADTDLTNIIFDLIRSSLLDTKGVCHCEAYLTLSRVLEEKDSYSSAQLDELIELLFTVKPPVDGSSLKNRFSCFECLLVYMLKSNVAEMNTKAFLILNEILLTLKSKKESRKMAYQSLLTISGKLKTHPDGADPDLLRLFSMVMGYLSSSSPHIMSAAVSALSMLIYHDAAFCLSVPNLIPSVLVLLQNKANEVIKATLGFIKVLVSSLICNELIKLLPEILQGVLPWSLVSKYHFRSKVSIIVEILIRKCSSEAVENQTPDKYKAFVKSFIEGRATRKFGKEANTSSSTERSADLIIKGGKKRLRENALNPSEKPSKDNSSSLHKKSGKKPETGFSNNKSSSKMHTSFKSRSTNSDHSNSHGQSKVWTRNTSTNNKRRYADKQNISGVDARKNKQRQHLNVSRDKKFKVDKSSVASRSVASSRFNKHRRRSS